MIYSEGSEALVQTAQRSYGCPIMGGVQGQLGWSPGRSYLAGGGLSLDGPLIISLKGLDLSPPRLSFQESVCGFKHAYMSMLWNYSITKYTINNLIIGLLSI